MKTINIEQILHQFSGERRIFQSEAQFQFELAWELQKQCDLPPTDGSKVYLEMVSATEIGEKKKRYYSDIIIRNDCGEYIVIELKYKTKNSTYGDVELLNHGATDLGRYDYLWDLHRIQELKRRNTSKYQFNALLQTFIAGYAIILSNDEHYWNVTRASIQGTRPLYYEFCIGNGDAIEANTEMRWRDGNNCVRTTSRDCILSFDKQFDIWWEDYYSEPNKDFKYLILSM